ncbi:photosystem I subunit O [Micractinium conductrix]|uniref:Photosystem I subunit O n=1 Tax=Micractinium conductrix TaxID=554055 RepID=A0A2P6V006_9CHLO|nr:photosystem I subunit O [Micractinium conductrix]|eukprot:PSC67374.1 photosystem I subunit O [Micractinium conductrix]
MQSAMTQSRGLAGSRLAARSARTTRVQSARAGVRVMAAGSNYQWLNKEPLALIAGFLGWFAPSNIAVPAFGGQSLFGAFTQSIGEELAHFPTGPALTDSFWILMVTWHMGLFACLFWGQIGVQARKQGYFN